MESTKSFHLITQPTNTLQMAQVANTQKKTRLQTLLSNSIAMCEQNVTDKQDLVYAKQIFDVFLRACFEPRPDEIQTTSLGVCYSQINNVNLYTLSVSNLNTLCSAKVASLDLFEHISNVRVIHEANRGLRITMYVQKIASMQDTGNNNIHNGKPQAGGDVHGVAEVDTVCRFERTGMSDEAKNELELLASRIVNMDSLAQEMSWRMVKKDSGLHIYVSPIPEFNLSFYNRLLSDHGDILTDIVVERTKLGETPECTGWVLHINDPYKATQGEQHKLRLSTKRGMPVAENSGISKPSKETKKESVLTAIYNMIMKS